ncbi:MAG TPA: M6 family metalloprotease domain-containing protein [Anaerolineaceae bacterium]|nr:M6 family metalloprotease domain-containing protein [Anaerolineaceae bacterium]
MGIIPSFIRSRLLRFFVAGCTLASLSLPLTASSVPQPANPAPVSPQGSNLEIMPPHPRLKDEIEHGIVVPPEGAPSENPNAAGLSRPGANTSPEMSTATTTSGAQSFKVLTVLASFSDKPGVTSPSYFNNLLFADPVAGRGSVRDYYNEVSYGQVDISTNTSPTAWIDVGHPISDYDNNNYCYDGVYPNNCQKLAEDLVDMLDPTVNFADYDNDGDGYVDTLVIVHAGRPAEYTGVRGQIWSHSWSLRNPRHYDGVWISDYVILPEYFNDPTPGDMTIGVFAHELGHSLWNMPDLYDRDNSSEGIGNWSLMASGSWNGPGSMGDSPAWPDAWTRWVMGWIDPAWVTTSVEGEMIRPVDEASPTDPQVYGIYNDQLGPGEFFMIENRQQTPGGYDEYLPGSGLLVWRIDHAMGYNQNDKECTSQPRWTCSDYDHYLVALEQADGMLQLEYGYNRGDSGDPFATSSYGIQTFSATSMPDTSSWYGSGSSLIEIEGISQSQSIARAIVADIIVLTPRAYIPLTVTPPET